MVHGRELVRTMQGVKPAVSVSSLLAPEVALHLYRITKEAVGNAVRHGNAARISIELGTLDARSVEIFLRRYMLRPL